MLLAPAPVKLFAPAAAPAFPEVATDPVVPAKLPAVEVVVTADLPAVIVDVLPAIPPETTVAVAVLGADADDAPNSMPDADPETAPDAKSIVDAAVAMPDADAKIVAKINVFIYILCLKC